MSAGASSTIGEFFLVLSEMGFTEEQIQAAVQAGHFSVPEAAEWLVQGQYPRHKLVKQTPQPAETAFSAFNPPKEATDTSQQQASPTGSQASPSLVLRASKSGSLSPEPLPVESRIKQDKSDFEEQERQRVAQEARAERRQKKQERELVLKRIAEDRKSLQQKTPTSAVTETSPPSGQGQKLGGQIQTNVDNNCVLMIRLPSGESIRERFPADAPLRSVVEHISGRHPSLLSFSLLQGFPRKRFGEAELACSLRSLGLTPNAALCIQTTPPETPQDLPNPADPLLSGQNEPPPPPPSAVPPQPQIPDPEDLGLPPPLPNQVWEEAVNYAGIPGAGPSLSGPSHFWGRGQRLVRDNDEEAAAIEVDEEEEGEEGPPYVLNEMARLPVFPENRIRGGFEPRHHWPEQGNRLMEAAAEVQALPEEAGGEVAPGAAGLAAVERLQRAAQQDDAGASQGQPSPPKRPYRTFSVSSLCALSTRATMHLMTAPSMQYTSSLAYLTPDLAERLLNHMASEKLLRPRNLELFFGCRLQKLVLNSYPYSTNELLRQLRAFTALKHLSLVNSPLITDSGLSILSSLVKLQYLNLSSCTKLTDSCLQHIRGLKSLCFLFLDETKVSDAGMVKYLRSAPSCLSQLSLNRTAVTDATLAVLPACVPQLRLLSVKHTEVKDVSALGELCSLQTLHLDGTGVTEESLVHIASLPALSVLSLASIPFGDSNNAVKIVSGLKLTHFNLPERRSFTDIGLSHLSNMSLLLELDLTDYSKVTDAGVEHLSSMTKLKKLSLSKTLVTDAGLASLHGLRDLQDLCLDQTRVTSRGVAELIVCLPQLEVLGLASTRVGDSVASRGLSRCNQLVKINLKRTRITDRGLKFLKHMHLAQVNLDFTGVTLAGIADLLSFSNNSSIQAGHTRTIPPDELSDEEWEAQ